MPELLEYCFMERDEDMVRLNGPLVARGRAWEQSDSHRALHYKGPWL